MPNSTPSLAQRSIWLFKGLYPYLGSPITCVTARNSLGPYPCNCGPLLTFPIAMGVRFFTVPAEMLREDKAEIEHLTSALETRERRKLVKTIVGRAIEEGERLLTRNSDGSLGSKEAAGKWVTATRNFISAAFRAGEATLLLSDSGYTFYSSDGQIGIWIKGRLRRLTELLARVETLDIRQRLRPHLLAIIWRAFGSRSIASRKIVFVELLGTGRSISDLARRGN
jgi:hypothetical protein